MVKNSQCNPGPPANAKPLTYNATLLSRTDHTDELATFRVQYDEPLEIEGRTFIPGQYVAIGLNNEEHPELGSVRRSMSLASAPEYTDAFDFYIRYVNNAATDNPLTHLLWGIHDGARIYMTRKPVGKFTIEHTLGADTSRLQVLVAAGTGIAPFLSVVRSMVQRDSQVDLSKVVILQGASYPADLGYMKELQGLVESNGMHYLPTVSRPNEAPDWRGQTGRVEDVFRPENIEKIEVELGLDAGAICPANAGVLICGLQGTIAKSVERLAYRGFVPDNRKIKKALSLGDEHEPSLWWEQYDSTPVIDIDDPTLVSTLSKRILNAIAGS
jgi:ferredoxin--NADP+ reductase